MNNRLNEATEMSDRMDEHLNAAKRLLDRYIEDAKDLAEKLEELNYEYQRLLSKWEDEDER